MGERARELATLFHNTNEEFIAFVKSSTDEQWCCYVEREGRTVRVLSHHIAAGHEGCSAMAMTVARGVALPPMTSAELDRLNAEEAKACADCTKQEVLDLLLGNGESVERAIVALTDEELARTGNLGGREMSVDQLVEHVVIGHVTGHFQAIREVLQ